MARLLVEGEWYDAIGARALYEREFETIALQNASVLFPGYLAVPFKQIVMAEEGSARPDLALIETGYRDWWVVEVEMGRHGLDTHVLPQVSVLANAQYGKTVAEHLAAHNALLRIDRLLDLMKGEQPRVLVVVDRKEPAWLAALHARHAELAVFEIFRSERNKYVYRFNGFQPSHPDEVLTSCRADRLMPWMLQIDRPGALPVQLGEDLSLWYENRRITWQRVDSSDRVWLLSRESRVQLPTNKVFQIVRRSDGSIQLREEVVGL